MIVAINIFIALQCGSRSKVEILKLLKHETGVQKDISLFRRIYASWIMLFFSSNFALVMVTIP